MTIDSVEFKETITQARRWTIQDVQSVLEDRQKELESKPLFNALDRSSQIEDLQVIAPHFYFFVLAFPDMLRLTYEMISDTSLKEVALSLAQDDAGHDQWYLFDLEQLGCTRDLRWLFRPTHQPVRDLVYQLTSNLWRVSDDRVRIIFPLALEATGIVFFKHIAGLVQRAGYDKSLRYFGSSHQEAEINHTIYEDGKEVLRDIEFDEKTYQEAIALVKQCFDSFECLADYLEQQRGDVF